MVADTVRQRQQFARKIKALTAMGRVSAYVLIGLPFFLALVLTRHQPQATCARSSHSRRGTCSSSSGSSMMVDRLGILRKIVSFKG